MPEERQKIRLEVKVTLETKALTKEVAKCSK